MSDWDGPGDEGDDDASEEESPQGTTRRAPRAAGEGVRIIGAEEAAKALEAGHVSPRRPGGAPRYGDVPEQPRGPRPSLSFPLPEDDDPAEVAPKRPVGSRTRPPAEEDAPAGRSLFEPPPGGAGSRPRPEPPSAADEERWAPPRRQAGAPASRPSPPPGPPPRTRPEPPPAAPAPPAAATTTPPPRPPRPPRSGARPAGPSGGGSGPNTGPTVLPHWSEPPTGEVPKILPTDDDGTEGDELGAWSTFASGPRWRDQAADWDEPDFEDAPLLGDEETRVGALAAEPEEPAEPGFLGEPQREPVMSQTTRRIGAPGGGQMVPPDIPYYDDQGGLREGAGRDVSVAVLTGAIVGAVVLVSASIGPAALLVVCTVFLVIAAAELYGALQQRGFHPATLLGLVGTASILGAAYWKGEQAVPLVLGMFVIFTLLWYLLGVVNARPAVNAAVTLMAFLYIGFFGSFVALLLSYPDRHGIAFLLGAVLSTVAYDVGAFFVGSRMGRTPLAGSVSPSKTVEGLMGGSTAALLVCLLIVRAIHPWNGGRAFGLAIVTVIAAPLGDLCESMIKRDLGVKDLGSILPGHGGVLDRIDALLFVVPATYYLVRLLKIA